MYRAGTASILVWTCPEEGRWVYGFRFVQRRDKGYIDKRLEIREDMEIVPVRWSEDSEVEDVDSLSCPLQNNWGQKYNEQIFFE